MDPTIHPQIKLQDDLGPKKRWTEFEIQRMQKTLTNKTMQPTTDVNIADLLFLR